MGFLTQTLQRRMALTERESLKRHGLPNIRAAVQEWSSVSAVCMEAGWCWMAWFSRRMLAKPNALALGKDVHSTMCGIR